MCGFAGMYTRKGVSRDLLEAMGEKIQHRGPDAQGVWCSENLGLVHRRLSIQDLGPAGAQPMASSSGHFVIAFNGEIYNFQSIRDQLVSLGRSFKGHSDTEVMLGAIEEWGVEAALDQFNGMFAFALVDTHEQKLHLARDRMGEKPLYYGWQSGTLLFGSELKALTPHPDWRGDINRQSLALLLRHNVIPAPHTIYKDIKKLPPASYISFSLKQSDIEWPEPKSYWSLENCFNSHAQPPTLEHAADHLEDLLGEVISEQMISDVPLGAFLSGGIDSSTVVALMQKQVSRRVRTFSIGFRERGFNEAEHAKAVAKYLGTEHTEMIVSPDDGLSLIPRLPSLYDEPFADSSQIPTFLVSQMTRKHVTVALSGDGGDELFCGYSRFPSTVNSWQNRASLKARLRKLAARLPTEMMANIIRRLVPGMANRSVATLAERLRREAASARAGSLSDFYRQGLSYWIDPERLVKSVDHEPDYSLTVAAPANVGNDPLKELMWRDLNWYLPDDILVKVDRAAMACSLETRVPLLDRRIVEYALRLPTELNMHQGIGKQVLREVLYRHVPRSMVDRPKQGFAVPLGSWLRTQLRDWAEALLDEKRLESEGYFHAAPIRALWRAHLQDVDDHSFQLWSILMFQAWLESRGDG